MEPPMASQDTIVDGKKEETSDHGAVVIEKCCADCKTTKTPLWRSGPSGPKSLCNACGIKYRKRKASTGSSPTSSSERKREKPGKGGLDRESVRVSLAQLGKDMLLQISAVAKKQRWHRKRKLREEELAAVCLMAMSSGSVFA